MSAYRSIVVGTDGSTTALRAVQRAAQVARDAQARLVIVSAYTPASREDVDVAEEALGDETFLVRGSTPAEENLRVAAAAAKELGVEEIFTQAVDGAPVDVLRKAVLDHGADLLVVGNRGLNTLTGRVLGSVPSAAARTAGADVLIVHTTS
ncbi:universal stress protein [Pseudonocardia alni]|uniref:universal stress protein n=1 Tax=Pseudonocardia alni TaxID=33907 RepID=UPI003697F268